MDYRLFYECLGFNLLDLEALDEAFPFFAHSQAGNNLNISAAAHAPYSVFSRAFSGLWAEWNPRRSRPQSVHLGESARRN